MKILFFLQIVIGFSNQYLIMPYKDSLLVEVPHYDEYFQVYQCNNNINIKKSINEINKFWLVC
jgi:hypothetical protein